MVSQVSQTAKKYQKCSQIVSKIRTESKRKSPKSLFNNNLGDFLRCVRDYNTRLCINTLSLVLKPVAHSGSALNLFQFLLEVVC